MSRVRPRVNRSMPGALPGQPHGARESQRHLPVAHFSNVDRRCADAMVGMHGFGGEDAMVGGGGGCDCEALAAPVTRSRERG